jgi:hypothetical protein
MRVISKREKGTFPTTIGKLIGEICACMASSTNKRNQVKVTGSVIFIFMKKNIKKLVLILKFPFLSQGEFP